MPPAVICVGAAHWDLIGHAAAPLAPGGDVPGRIERRPGGVAANVALALAGLGRPCALVAAVGRDPDGDALAALLTARGVDCEAVLRHAGATDAYLAVEDAGGGLFAAVADCAGLEASAAALPGAVRAAPPAGPVVADGNLPGVVLAEIATAAAARGARLVVAAASPAKAARLGPLLGTPGLTLYLNRHEAEALCGAAFLDSRAAAVALMARGLATAVVTDGAAAATHATATGAVSLAPSGIAGGVTGAGDAFLAGHLAAVEDGLPPEAALRAALAAAARHITRAAS
jgi:sugar/nucleoside kinase (ribokinase family)